MHDLQNTKFVSVTPPAAIVDNASFTTAEIDTKGFNYARIVVYLGATDIAFTALKVTESDTAGSGHADVTGLVYGTSALMGSSTTSSLPSATDDNKFFVFHVPLAGRKRYLDLVATIGDGTAGGFMAAWCELYRGNEIPDSATERGVAAQLIA